MSVQLSKILTYLFFIVQLACTNAQVPVERPHCQNTSFDKKVSKTISFTVPLMDVNELAKIKDEVTIFDTRKKEEYEVSHIDGAQYLGYRDFDVARLEDTPKDSKIVLYCSIGYRSEKIGEQLQDLGYTNVYNLYGSLFEWMNQGYEVVDKDGNTTKKVHTYNKNWSKWVEEGKGEKLW